jgi:hypothetical protein
MRRAMLVLIAGCRIGEHIASAPIDSGPDAPPPDAYVPDAEPPFQGLLATIGDVPQVTGSCNALDDYAEMTGHFASPVQEMPVDAGWEFDTSADTYNDATFGFDPNWSGAQFGAFSVRFRGTIELTAGAHCFSVDIGATGTDIITGQNGCGQLYIGANTVALAETGYDASSASAWTACTTTPAGPIELDVVYWYFNIFNQARLVVRTCDGDACTPDQPLDVAKLRLP